MSLSDATAAYRRADLARGTADSATISISTPRTNRSANSMGMITIDGLMEIAVIYFILWRNNDQTAPVLPSSSSGTATLSAVIRGPLLIGMIDSLL